MAVELCHYRLALRGKPVGSQLLSVEERGHTALLDAQLSLQGSLGNADVRQRSTVHQQRFFSFAFEEETRSSSERRSFSVTFDAEAGLVRASRGSDQATAPYLQAFEDPLGLLYHLRRLGPDEVRLRVPMLGKEVLVERLGDTELETVLGPRRAYAYVLQPGGSYVYVDQQAPHLILQLSQRLDGQLLEALLVRVDEEAARPQPEATDSPRPRRRRSGRQRRRRKG